MRRAVVLMNLGGPDTAAAVEPFLRNLFGDPAIIGLPVPLRLPLAWLLARFRLKAARQIYARLGGGSPLLGNTEAQARALEAALDDGSRCFVAMRYWRPSSAAAAAAVAGWMAEEVVCLPLYPQYSTMTTGSSLTAWRQAAAVAGVVAPTRIVCSYPQHPGFVAALARLIAAALDQALEGSRLLLTAHGLPQRVVRAGDPYCRQVEATAAAVVAMLSRPGLDWAVCYQSRVGPLPWVGPETAAEIRRAGVERVPLVVAPISFVSEHSETLVELDIDYRRLARESGVPGYFRVPAVGTAPEFIDALAGLVRRASAGAAG